MNAAQFQDAVAAVLAVARSQEATKMARAIRSTEDRHRHGFMAHTTLQHHLTSLWGAVDAKGLRPEVEQILGVR